MRTKCSKCGTNTPNYQEEHDLYTSEARDIRIVTRVTQCTCELGHPNIFSHWNIQIWDCLI